MISSACRRLAFESRSHVSTSLNNGFRRPLTLARPSGSPSLLPATITTTTTTSCRYSSSNSKPSNNNNNNNGSSSLSRTQPFRRKQKRDVQDSSSPSSSPSGGVLAAAAAAANSSAQVSAETAAPEASIPPQRTIPSNPILAVPQTDHLHPSDVALTSFFALHRPVSIISPVPAKQDDTHFSKLFEEVAEMPRSAFRQMQNAIEEEMETLDVNERSAGNETTVGGSSSTSNGGNGLESQMEPRYLPFQPPPPPGAEPKRVQKPQQSQLSDVQARNLTQAAALLFAPNQEVDSQEQEFPDLRKRFITLVESTLPDGSVHISAQRGVIVPSARSSFQDRKRRRQIAYYDRLDETKLRMIHALSTLRRRKLKIKKHKLKKLRKKQRNMKRKLDRV